MFIIIQQQLSHIPYLRRMKADCRSDLERYFELKKDIQLPVKARLYFLIFQNVLDQNKSTQSIESKKGFSKALLNAFSNLSPGEKGQYLLNSISFVVDQLDRQEKEKTKADSKIETDEIRQVETTCDMLLSTLKIHYWATVSLKLDKIKKLLSVTNKKKSFAIDMMNYYVRRSKKYKNSIVLEATTQEINNEAKKYVFCFNQQIVAKIYEQMLKCCFSCQHQKILSLLVEEEDNEKEEKHNLANHDKALVFLNSKNINDYLAYKERVEKQIMQNKFQFRTLLSEGTLKIEQSSKFEKVFRMQNTFQVDAKELKEKFVFAFDHHNKFVIDLQVLQEFSKKYKAVYEKLSLKDRTYEYISIREESFSAQEEVLFVKGVQNIMGKNYIEFIQARVRNLNPCLSKLIIYLSIGLSTVITKDVVKMFMIEFNEMVFRKKDKSQKNSFLESSEGVDEEDVEDFKTVKGSEQFVGFIEDNEGADGMDIDFQASIHSNQKGDQKKKLGYLLKRSIQVPVDDEKYRKMMTEHYLFKEWKRIKGGGVVCTNEKQVNNQKNLFKTGLSRMGKGILKGQLLRISLPVTIFRQQSHLETMARNFCYAPVFFDKLAIGGNALERVKYATLLAISVGTLGISLQKPFNPILGETIQLRIDGCPIYLEQISHHPPIGAYYFQGRSYRIHGQIEPRISFGLNNIKGFSSRPNYLEFQDGTVIQMAYGKMVIKGLLFGEREFNFEDKIFVFDVKNNIFSQIIYGPRKKTKAKDSHDPSDFIHGTIFKVTAEFAQKFNKSVPRIFPNKSNIISELSRFEGVWNGEILFDGKTYINFEKDLPPDIVPEDQPLLSNSSYRSDLLKLIHGTIDQAQKEKDRLEELQRRDNRLREKFK